MNTERWQRVGDIFERLLEVPEAEREKHLVSLCGDDQQLRGIVVSMLDSHESPRFSDASLNTLRDTSQAAAEALLRGEPPPRDTETEGTRIGPWRLARRIGAGGMGVVWLAERADGQFKQRAALKLIKRGMDSEAVLARFLRERQILARLEHRNIAHLLDGGIAPDGRPYFAMEYVEGLPLLAYCNEHHFKLEERLRLFLQVCAALRFAHAQHVVHRDIKPSNILVTADGSVKLLDFGIAKLLQGDDELTSTLTGTQREQPMTPAYAAPEQIAGGEVTEATDVYALGVVFYELLSGRRPHDFSAAADAHDVLKIILATDPVAPGRLKLTSSPVPLKHLRGDLDTIALTALRQMPTRRYPSVAAFAADIENYLAGRPIAARRDHVFYRGYKFARRHRMGLAAIIALAAAGALAVAIAFIEPRARGIANSNASYAIVGLGNVAENKDYPWVSSVFVPMLANELAHGSNLRRISDDLVRDAVHDIRAPSADGLSIAEIDVLRSRLRADYVLSGSYVVVGSGAGAKLRMDLAMQGSLDGASVASVSQSGPISDLPGLVERIGADLRTQLGFSMISADTKRQVAQVQPPNLEVARHMGIALDALRRSDASRAKAELMEVNMLAPDYAAGYTYLSDAYKSLGYGAKALAAAQQALARSANLTPDDQAQIARRVAVLNSDWKKALEIDQKIVAARPGDLDARLDFIDDLRGSSDLDRAEAELAKARTPGVDDARIELRAARIAGARGDARVQAEYAQRALDIARKHDEFALAGEAGRRLGIAREQMGRLADAAVLYRQAIADYARSKNPKGEADARTDLAILLDQQNQLDQSQEEYQRALKIYQDIGDEHGLNAIYSSMSLLLWAKGDVDAAEAAARRVLAFYIETGNVERQAWALTTLANYRLAASADDEAIDNFSKAISLNQRAGNRSQLAFTQISLSRGLAARGELERAAKACEDAGVEARAIDASGSEVGAIRQCAEVAWLRGNTDSALAGLKRAVAIARTNGFEYDLALSERLRAKIDLSRGRLEEAAATLAGVVKILADADQKGDEAIAQAMYAVSLRGLNRSEDSARAAERAKQLRSTISIRLDAMTVDILLAELAGGSGHPKEAADQLVALADEAEKRYWNALAFQARVAAVDFFSSAQENALAHALRAQVDAAAKRSGFGWAVQRVHPHPPAK